MTTLQKTNATLPEADARYLREARDSSLTDFQAGVIALRNNNWPLRAIGEVFDVTRVAAKAWHLTALENPEAVKRSETYPAPQLPINARGRDARPKRLKPDLPPAEQERVKELAASASNVRRWTPQDSPSRSAAKNLEQLVYKYVNDYGVSPSTIAEYAGVSRRAIVQRFEKAKEAAL